MNKQLCVPLQPLSRDAFSLYGQAFMVLPGQEPDDAGSGWQCWYPVGTLEGFEDSQVGIVRTDPRPLSVHEMERHLARAEYVFALDRPLIQTVALSNPIDDANPDPNSFNAFFLQPGQGMMIAKGVWHGVGLPAGCESTLYGFVLGQQSDDPAENSGWVGFNDGVSIEITV